MPIPETFEEFIAKKINPRNYSDILPIIYQLRKRQDAEYIPTAFERIIYASLAVGENGASADFNALATSTFTKSNITGGSLVVGSGYTIMTNSGGANFTNVGAANNNIGTVFKATGTTPAAWGTGSLANAIVLEGTATYKLVSGATVLSINPAIKVTAQIDIGRDGSPTSLPAYQIDCLPSEINSTTGFFSFFIPSSTVQRLSVGIHYVYIDAHSPNNRPTRLIASGATNNQRSFTITA